jgi:hypothetical protein
MIEKRIYGNNLFKTQYWQLFFINFRILTQNYSNMSDSCPDIVLDLLLLVLLLLKILVWDGFIEKFNTIYYCTVLRFCF